MKKTLTILIAVCCFVPAMAQEKAETPAAQAPVAEAGKTALVPAKLAELKQLNDAKVKTGADYYIILSSASWCPPCRAEAPHIVKEYENISKDGTVELILFSADREEQKALDWAKKENMTYPIFFDRPNYGVIPAYKENKPNYIPHAMIVDKDGKLVANVAYVEKDGKRFKAIVDAEGNVLAQGGVDDLVSGYKKYCK